MKLNIHNNKWMESVHVDVSLIENATEKEEKVAAGENVGIIIIIIAALIGKFGLIFTYFIWEIMWQGVLRSCDITTLLMQIVLYSVFLTGILCIIMMTIKPEHATTQFLRFYHIVCTLSLLEYFYFCVAQAFYLGFNVLSTCVNENGKEYANTFTLSIVLSILGTSFFLLTFFIFYITDENVS